MSKPIKTKRSIYLLWLTLCLLSFSLYTLYWWQHQHILHTQKHNAITQQIGQLQAQADTVLESFAAFQSRQSFPTDQSIRPFAQLLLKRNPHIYCLQTVQRVLQDDVNDLELTMRSAGYPQFRVHDFDFNQRSRSLPKNRRDTYFPIVFMEPLPSDIEAVLGLDIGAVYFLWPQLEVAGKKVKAWSTGPFQMIEGDIAYGMTIPVYQLGGQNSDNSWPLYTGLVIKASSLIPSLHDLAPGWQFSMNYTGSAITHKKQLFNIQSAGESNGLDRLLPMITFSSAIASESQPYSLTSSQQLSWRTWLGLVPLMMITFLILLLLLALRWQHSERLRQIAVRRHRNQLQRWATQDRLTHCANRQNFDQHMIKVSKNQSAFTLVYLDLDFFKPINDHYGHLAGDAVLIEVASRLRKTVRSQDMVARWGGDEFAILVVGLDGKERCVQLRETLANALLPPFMWQSQTIHLSASIGLASYPAEANNLSDLLHLADQRMYSHKAALRNRDSQTSTA